MREEKIYLSKLFDEKTSPFDIRDHISGFSSNRGWYLVVVSMWVDGFPKSDLGNSFWREHFAVYEPPVKDLFRLSENKELIIYLVPTALHIFSVIRSMLSSAQIFLTLL